MLGCEVLAERYGSPLAMMYMAPNFGINQSFAWLLTLPGSRFFIPLILGATRTWEAESEAVAKYWSTSYSTLAVIEMQKVVDWFEAQSPASWNMPLGIMLGDLDPTISAKKRCACWRSGVTLVQSACPFRSKRQWLSTFLSATSQDQISPLAVSISSNCSLKNV